MGPGPWMPPELVTGRDLELIAAGIGCFLAASWFGLSNHPRDWHPVLLFVVLGGTSLVLAWWDIRTRGGLSRPRGE